ncbi:MAG: hypothetical protein AB7U82_00795 [Blastocatellales bacterium]
MKNPEPGVRLLVATAALSLLATMAVFAQSADAQPSTQSIEELRRRLVEMEKEVQALRQSVTQLEEQQKRATQQASQPSSSQTASTQATGTAGAQGSSRPQRPITELAKLEAVNRDRETVARIDNQPLDPKLIGFFPIPETRSRLKIDGYAKLDWIFDPRPDGNPDQFITTTIPVNLTPSQRVVNSNVIFRESRINLDFRTPLREGREFRFYAEVDFFGPDGPTDPRLRHLYGQTLNLLAGHTWTTFTDPDTIPDTLDFQSPAGIIKTRQAQFRYTQPIGRHHSLAFAVERPGVRGPDLTPDGSLIRSSVVAGILRRIRGTDDTPNDGPYNPAPDFVVRYRYERVRWHMQFGSLYRVLGFRSPLVEEKAFGWGLNFASGIMLRGRDNLLLNATYGHGISRYIANLDDLDLDFDLDDSGAPIKALPVVGAYGAYQHYWTDQLRSTVTFGYDRVQNAAFQPVDAFNKSYYAAGNLIWRPLEHYNFTVGAEFLYGWQVLKDNSKGFGNRVQVSLQYNLYRKPTANP